MLFARLFTITAGIRRDTQVAARANMVRKRTETVTRRVLVVEKTVELGKRVTAAIIKPNNQLYGQKHDHYPHQQYLPLRKKRQIPEG